MSPIQQVSTGSQAYAPLKASAQLAADSGRSDEYVGGGVSHLPEYWTPNLKPGKAEAVGNLLELAQAHPLADVSAIGAMPSGSWVMQAHKQDDGFVTYELHQLDGPMRSFEGNVGSTKVPLAECTTVDGSNYHAMTPDGEHFSASAMGVASHSPFMFQDTTGDYRVYRVDPQVAKALLQQTGKTPHNWGFINPQDQPPPTLGDHLKNGLQGIANIGHTIADAVTAPAQLVQMGEDIANNE